MRKRPLANVRILVVDDDIQSLKLYRAILSFAGAVTLAATNAEEGLALLKDFKAQIVVTDLRLQGMTGIQFASVLSGQGMANLPVIVVVTSDAEASLSGAARAAGCIAVLRKPIDALTFADQVADYLGRSSEPEERR